MPRLSVVHIITKLELGGAQQNTLYTLAHLDRDVFEPHLICGTGGILDSRAKEIAGLDVHFCGPLIREINLLKDWQAYRQIKDTLTDLRPQIVHTHSSKAGILARLAAAAARVPVIIHTYHGFGFHRHQNRLVFQAYLNAERFAARKTTHLIFVSHDNWRWAEKLGLCRFSSASLIRSGVEAVPLDRATAGRQLREELGIPKEAKLVGMVACLKKQKDPLTYVEAADRVARNRKDVFFLLVGDGELRDQVEQRARAMERPEQFRVVGWRFDIMHVMAGLDLLVLTSRWEGLPRVIPEAAICRVPVVASDIDGNREIIRPGKNGFLVPPGDADGFAEAIRQALESESEVDAELSRQISEEFDIRKMVRKEEELYLQLSSGLCAGQGALV